MFLSYRRAGANGSVVQINSGETAELKGFTIKNGATATDGGGIYIDNSTAILSNLIIKNNEAYHGGGGVYSYNSTLVVNNSIISNNITIKSTLILMVKEFR